MKKIALFIFLSPLLIFSQAKEPSLFAKRVSKAFDVVKTSVKTVPTDFGQMGKTVSEDWKRTALYTGIVGGLMLVDRPVTEFYQEHMEANLNYKIPNITINRKNNNIPWVSGNDAYMFYSMTGIYAGSLITGYEKGQYAAINAFKSLTYSILISHVILKSIFTRARPNTNLKDGITDNEHTTNDPHDFFNGRGGVYLLSNQQGTALPSLHATAFFAMAKVFQMEFDNYWIPYGFAAIVFGAEFKEHRHWVSDMVAGGIIGTIIGRAVVRSSWKARGILPDKEKAITFKCVPTISSSYNGLQIVANF